MIKSILLICVLTVMFLLSNTNLFAQKDLQIYSWTAPKSKGALTDNETVRFYIKNVGAESVSNFTVGFSQDGGVTYKEEVVTSTIDPGKLLLYTFSSNYAVLGTDGALYHIMAKITLAEDVNQDDNVHTEEIKNYLIGDVQDEPFEMTSFPYTDTREYVFYTHNYGDQFNISNYMQTQDIVYTLTTTETQMYVDAKVTTNYVNGFAPKPGVVLIRETPSTFNKYSSPPDVETATGYGAIEASFTDAYCYYAQTYYLVVDKWTDYSVPYTLEVNLYRQHDFKSFSFAGLSVDGDIDYDNRIVTLTVPQGTDLTNLVATFELPAYTEVLVGGVSQTSGLTSVDFTNDVTYTINQTITPYTTQTWTVKVVEGITNDIETAEQTTVVVSPNPATDQIHILAGDFGQFNKVNLYNASGSNVLTLLGVQAGESISIDNFPKGLYIVQIELDNKQLITRFIKK